MKPNIVLIVIALLLAFALPVSAQERPPQRILAGSVFKTQSKSLDAGTRQVGLNGRADASVGIVTYLNPFSQPIAIAGLAISKIIGGSAVLFTCAQVETLSRNGASFGGTPSSCGDIGSGVSVRAEKLIDYHWTNATWRTDTLHRFRRLNGTSWEPRLTISLNL